MKIIYGIEPPEISFIIKPNGEMSFTIENRNYIDIDDSPSGISWLDLYYGKSVSRTTDAIPRGLEATEAAVNFINKKFLDFDLTEHERKFFTFYVELCASDADSGTFPEYDSMMLFPALIPQVWVNWIHYDSKDVKRAERAQREPFRIDFLIKDESIKGSLLIIEIDGASHFGAYADDPQKAMLVYTEHLRKDRWLRKQGWNVLRISNYEIASCQTLRDFQKFFWELTEWHLGDV